MNESTVGLRRALAALTLLGAILISTHPLQAQKEAAHAASVPAPEKLWAAQTGATVFTLSWQAVPGALAYQLLCKIGDGPLSMVGRPASNATQWLLRIAREMLSVEHRCFLRAETAKGLSEQVAFNPVVAQKAAAPPQPPASVTATQTGGEEITVSWGEVTGATAYFIARSVAPDGFRILCQLCPVTPTYVDRDVIAGVRHSYSVAAVTPSGTSQRVTSNALSPDTDFGIAPDEEAGTPGSPDTGPGGWTPGGTSTGGTPGGTSTGGTPGGNPGGNPGGTSTGGNPGGTSTGGNPGGTSTGGTPGGTSTGGTPGGTSTGGTTGSTSTGGTATTTPVRMCTLEYQRADNMWAAAGRPDGDLGTERVTLQAGQTRSFVTDWRYEKTRNDGTNYYGSHTRITTNVGERPVQIRIKGVLADKRRIGGGGIPILNGYEITLSPGERVEMTADLQEVSCDVKG